MRYTLDWQAIDLDGANTLTSGGQQIGVTVSTPETGGDEGTQWALGGGEGEPGTLRSGEVRAPTVLELSFDRAVTDLSFDVHDLDAGPGSPPWEDRVTLVTRDAEGGETRIALSDLSAPRGGEGATEGTSLNAAPPPDSVPVYISGPVTGLKLVHDAGDDAQVSGTVGVSDLHFEAAPASDGIVHGTDGDDVIVEDGYVDDDGDEIDNGDAILFDDAPDDDRVLAKAGDDVVDADDGDDTVEGGAGADDIAGGAGDDSLWGGDRGGSPSDIPDDGASGAPAPDPDPENDRDTLSGGAGNDSVVGGDDDDVIFGGSGDDTLDGGIDDDSISGGAGHDSVIGGSGDDTLDGGADADVVRGGAGDDVITGGQGHDLLEGGDDSDTFVLTSAENDSGDTISGGAGG
ncbi:MAG: hypothetical protein GVY27_03880, partial [Deinococcus-Thermus bacterium]|nr:hypothetical protein [Deinococcota bacterium]